LQDEEEKDLIKEVMGTSSSGSGNSEEDFHGCTLADLNEDIQQFGYVTCLMCLVATKVFDSSSLSCSNEVNGGLMVFCRFRGYREF